MMMYYNFNTNKFDVSYSPEFYYYSTYFKMYEFDDTLTVETTTAGKYYVSSTGRTTQLSSGAKYTLNSTGSLMILKIKS